MGLKNYRTVDLTIWLVIMCAIEAISLLVMKRIGSMFVLSVIVPVTLIIFVRWNYTYHFVVLVQSPCYLL